MELTSLVEELGKVCGLDLLLEEGRCTLRFDDAHEVTIERDGDAVVLLIEQIGGAACHEGYRSCFSRELRDGKVSRCSELVFDPKEVYNG